MPCANSNAAITSRATQRSRCVEKRIEELIVRRCASWIIGPMREQAARPEWRELCLGCASCRTQIMAANSRYWYRTAMKIATWNVNGIRAREAQFCEWLARDQPDVVCLQELKAEPAQIPERCKHVDYHVYWHGLRAYSGVSLHVRKELLDADPQFTHPDFDMEARIVQVALGNMVVASVYVPNGGKDYAAKIGFFTRLAAWARQVHDEGRGRVLCGGIHIARPG